MALLTEAKRKEYLKYLGYTYDEKGIKALQKKYLRKKDVDGIYGTDTDRLLRHVYNVTKHTKNFAPEEFKCECGGKYCTGYPSWMKKVELVNLQSIRDHYGKPMTVTCGLRCKTYNSKLKGSISNSKHLSGYACDFYMKGVTDTLRNRKAAIKYIKTLPNHNYTYGNGINSKGIKVSASYMGNALHTDTNKPVTVSLAASASTTTLSDKILSACKTQAEWMKNYTYSWESNPTVEKSKKKGTCVTYVACVLQRIGYLNSGKYIWHDEKGKVTHATSKMKVTYPSGTLKSLKSTLKAGDIVLAGTKSNVGSGSHIFIFGGKWKGDDPYIYDNHSAEKVKAGKSAIHTYSGDKKVIAVVRLKTTTTKTMTKASKLLAQAKKLAWAKGTKSSVYKYPDGNPTDEFKAALKKAYPNRDSWSDAPKKGASCDVFVGTCVRSAGIDKDFPRGLDEQMKYTSKKFTKYTYKNIAPKTKAKKGDIIIYTHSNGTHIVIMGDGCYYEANYKKKYGHVNTSKRLSDKFKKVIIFRPKG